MHSFLYFLFSIKVALCSCGAEVKRSGFGRGRPMYTVRKLGQLPMAVNESSGLVFRGVDRHTGQRMFWTHNDSGGKPTLYGVSEQGVLVDSLPLPSLTNVDWEDLAQQDSTALFIGDIGNNANSRQELRIYRVDLKNPLTVNETRFRYAGLTGPTGVYSPHNADSEALIYYNDHLYTVSKNRSPTNRFAKLYRIPARSGAFTATAIDSIYIRSMVTGGAISPDRKTIALVTYGKMFLFGISGDTLTFSKPLSCIRVPRGQTEALCFVSATDLVMSNEKGTLFLLQRKREKNLASQ